MTGSVSHAVSGEVTKSEFKYAKDGKGILFLTIPVEKGFGETKKTTWWKVAVQGQRGESLAKIVQVPTGERARKMIISASSDNASIEPYVSESTGKMGVNCTLWTYNAKILSWGDVKFERNAQNTDSQSNNSSADDDELPF